MTAMTLGTVTDADFFALFHGRKEVPYESRFIEKVVSMLNIDLSPVEMTAVKWLAFKTLYLPNDLDYGTNWRDPRYTELDRERIMDLIFHVKTAHRLNVTVPQWFRDFHEFGVFDVKSPYDAFSDEESAAQHKDPELSHGPKTQS